MKKSVRQSMALSSTCHKWSNYIHSAKIFQLFHFDHPLRRLGKDRKYIYRMCDRVT